MNDKTPTTTITTERSASPPPPVRELSEMLLDIITRRAEPQTVEEIATDVVAEPDAGELISLSSDSVEVRVYLAIVDLACRGQVVLGRSQGGSMTCRLPAVPASKPFALWGRLRHLLNRRCRLG